MAYKVAVVGATGAVGREMLKTLAERTSRSATSWPSPPPRSAGQEISLRRQAVLKIQNLETFDFAGWDIGLFSPGAAVSAIHAPRAAAAGCIVIDNTSQFRMEPDVPLVVPEVNPQALAASGAASSPTRTARTIQMVVALKPLHDRFRLKRVVVATYQSVSGAGKDGMDELFDQSRAIFVHDPLSPQEFHQADRLQLSSPTSTASWMTARPRRSGRWRSRPARSSTRTSSVFATCVRVPVFIGHAEAVSVEFERPVSVRRRAPRCAPCPACA